jgi:hypothetical protein
MLRLRKPSPAMVVACIALFVALSGLSTAAVVVLAKNSVLSKHIRNGQVRNPDIGVSAVDSSKVRDGALLMQDFAPGQVPAGPQGAKGDKGDKGDQGDPGPLITPEAWKEVGASGQPAFITQTCFDPVPFDYFPMTWTNFDVNHNSLAFYKDPFGRVHLKGLIKNGSTFDHGTDLGGEPCGKIFELPAGYRPAKREVVATITYFTPNGTTNSIRVSRLNIDPNGLVWAAENATQTWFSLDNVSFRAAG